MKDIYNMCTPQSDWSKSSFWPRVKKNILKRLPSKLYDERWTEVVWGSPTDINEYGDLGPSWESWESCEFAGGSKDGEFLHADFRSMSYTLHNWEEFKERYLQNSKFLASYYTGVGGNKRGEKMRKEELKSSFPIRSFVIIRGNKWKKEDFPTTWWIKDRCAVVIGNHYNEEGGEEIEVAITKPNGDMVLNTWMLPEELELAEHQRNKPVWEQEETECLEI